MKTKIEIVSGFLGSGKTSFINSYLETDICLDKEILIILLEKGFTKLENNSNNIEIILLEESSELKKVLIDKIKYKKYHRVIIEFNGTENLNLIADIFNYKDIKKNFSFYGNYYIGDSSNLLSYLRNLGEIIIPFIKSSKLIVLNNLEVLDEEKQKKLINDIEEINPIAPIVLSQSIEKLSLDLKASEYFKERDVIKSLKLYLINWRKLDDKVG